MLRFFWLFGGIIGVASVIFLPMISVAEKALDSVDCIQISAEKIRSSCRETPLIKILTTIYQNKGTDFSISEENLHDKVTASFEFLPMDEGVKKFLTGRNYSFIYDSDGKLIKVIYLGKKKSVGLSSIINTPVDSRKEEKVEAPPEIPDSGGDRMTVSDSGSDVMTISSDGEKMEITSDNIKMDIKDDGEAMTVDSGGEKMEVSEGQ